MELTDNALDNSTVFSRQYKNEKRLRRFSIKDKIYEFCIMFRQLQITFHFIEQCIFDVKVLP